MKLHFFTLFFLIALVTSCGVSKVDSTSEKNFNKSIERVKGSLDAKKKIELEKAIQIITFSETTNVFQAAADIDGLKRRAMDKLNGKTADEIIAEGVRLTEELQIKQVRVEAEKAERRRKAEIENEQQEMLRELQNIQRLLNRKSDELTELEEKRKALQQKKETYDNEKLELKWFFVLIPRFYFRKGKFGDEPVIELNIANETKHAVGKVSFHGVLSSPDRTVPWVQDSFEYEISGGIEPNEKAIWVIKPNMFSNWEKAPKNKNDMVLEVTVKMIYGADKEPIFKSIFSIQDEKKLIELNEGIELKYKQIDDLNAEIDRQLKIAKIKWPKVIK